MEGICRLCQNHAELQLSHVIPAFVFKWLKKGGPIRHSANINQRVQDGLKFEWLCASCEARFNVWETQFAKHVFHPLTNNADTAHYSDWLLKFCASLSWRSLLHAREQNLLTHFSIDRLAQVDEALKVWGEFLRGERPHPTGFEQHLLPLGAVESAPGMRLPPNINRYFLRTVQLDAICSRSISLVFSKLGSIAVIGFIHVPKPKQWIGTKIKVRGGTLRPREYVLPAQFGKYLVDKASDLWKETARISDVQRQKVDAHVRANLDQFARSEVFKTILLDAEMFGRAAFHD